MGVSELAGYRTAMELDLARGRAPELEPTAGAVQRAAVAVGVPCPALDDHCRRSCGPARDWPPRRSAPYAHRRPRSPLGRTPGGDADGLRVAAAAGDRRRSALAHGRRGRRACRPRPATGPRFRPPAAGERARAPPRPLRRFRAGRRGRGESRYHSRRRCGRSPSSAWRACAFISSVAPGNTRQRSRPPPRGTGWRSRCTSTRRPGRGWSRWWRRPASASSSSTTWLVPTTLGRVRHGRCCASSPATRTWSSSSRRSTSCRARRFPTRTFCR